MNRVLIANRGEIAVRILRACRELGLGTVAIYADGDADAPVVDLADRAVSLAGETAAETYLDVDKIIEAARRSEADAVHPGYGFLSEQPGLARACADAGLVFVGPPAEVMERVGDKEAARRSAHAAEVPLVPGIPAGEPEQLRAAAAELGFPLLVKAVHGGGGRGMRLVEDGERLDDALIAAGREAAGAFGSAALYLEKALPRPRHVEVQILADAHGAVIHLGERECSVQRRHQKLVEESPSPLPDPPLRSKMCQAAVRLASQVGYVGAGTVEFLVDDDGFYFLEVNARLQVEHPVTELVTGVDLVQAQLRIAAGERLWLSQSDIEPRGHAIEARLYAEDPAADFLPSVGTVLHVELPLAPGVRVDSGIVPGLEISPHFDPLLAKVIAWAEDRQSACRRLAWALHDTRVLGVKTNQGFLRRLMSHPDFVEGRLHTGFIDEHRQALIDAEPAPVDEQRVAAALAAVELARSDRRIDSHETLGDPYSPWRWSKGA